jgi:hypothetical protein
MYFDCAISKKKFSVKSFDQKGTFLVFLREKNAIWGIFGPFFDDNSIM